MSFRIHEVPVAINLHHLVAHSVPVKKDEEPTIVDPVAEFTVKVVDAPKDAPKDAAESAAQDEVVYRIRRNRK